LLKVLVECNCTLARWNKPSRSFCLCDTDNFHILRSLLSFARVSGEQGVTGATGEKGATGATGATGEHARSRRRKRQAERCPAGKP